MKAHVRRLVLVGVLVVCGWLGFSTSIRAQEATAGALIINPNPLTITTPWGCSPIAGSCTQQVQLTIQATAQVNDMRMIVEDLRRSDNAAIISAATIDTQIATTALAPGDIVTMTVKLPLSAIAAGEYNGNLLMSYSGGVERIPVSVRVRDWWFPPLLLLIGTLLLGMGFKYYRDSVQPHDNLLVQISYLSTWRSTQSELLPAFGQHIDLLLESARSALNFGKQNDTQTLIATAQTIQQRWSRHRAAWLELGKKTNELRSALDAVPILPNSILRQSIEEALAQSEREMPLNDDPEAIRTRLLAIREMLVTYQALNSRLDTLTGLLLGLDDDRVFRATLNKRRSELQNLTFGDQPAIEQLQTALDADEAAIRQARTNANVPEPDDMLLGGGDGGDIPLSSAGLPFIGALIAGAISDNPATTGKVAAWRLRLFQFAGLLISAVGLIPLGFTQLYVDKATFGLNPWLDYPALIFWALGIEATREGVMGLIERKQDQAQ